MKYVAITRSQTYFVELPDDIEEEEANTMPDEEDWDEVRLTNAPKTFTAWEEVL